MDQHTGAVLGDEAVLNGRMGNRREETPIRGPRWEGQNGISDGQADGRNRGGFL